MNSTVDTARTSRGLVPRLLSRALLVLSGAVLATVAGWLISSAAASADTLPTIPAVPTPVTSVLRTADHAVAEVLTSHPRSAAPLAHALPLPGTPGQATDGVRGVAGALGNAVSRLRAQMPGRSVVVPLNVLPATPAATPTPVRAGSMSTPADDRAPDRAASVAATEVPPPAHVGAVPARFLVARSPVAAPVATGRTPVAPAPAAPYPAPWNPIPVPPATGGGGVCAPSLGGVGFDDESGTWPGPGFDLVRAVEASTPLGTPGPGRQPGITPD